MDANGLRFWMLANESDWHIKSDLVYDRDRKTLRLKSTSTRTLEQAAADEPIARTRLDLVPGARDGFGTRAAWDPARGAIVATGALPGSVPILAPSAADPPTDLVMGYDGVLYVALTSGAIVLQDRRGRWDSLRLQVPGFTAWRLAADPAGGVWALDREHRRLARLQGLPLPTRPYGPYAPDTSRPCEENPNPPRLTVYADDVCSVDGQPALDEVPVGLAVSPDGRVALLSWWTSGDQTRTHLHILDGERFGPPCTLRGAPRAFSVAWVSASGVAVLLPNLSSEAPVYPVVSDAAETPPVGDLYPLSGLVGGAFLHGLDLPPHYPTAEGTEPLYHLSLPSLASDGVAATRVTAPLDSGNVDTAWHRLYLEADIPPGCSVRVLLTATDQAGVDLTNVPWYEHVFGQAGADGVAAGVPRGAWIPARSEVPFHPGLLPCPPVESRTGLFTVLIQRAGRPVRTLRGRYLHVRIQLHGVGRATPEVAALRAYASRFSYVERYLPQLYHEACFGPDADGIEETAGSHGAASNRTAPGNGAVAGSGGPVGNGVALAAPDHANGLVHAVPAVSSTPADFLERFLGNFEGLLTPLEDRIASSYLLTDPQAAPEGALEWLGSWIGLAFDPAYPAGRRRRLLRETPRLCQLHGTLDGLRGALDVATDGAVTRGQVVVLEEYRLRRTFATILGADLADESDPLTGGIAVSGNSYVGDTLFLGDEHQQEFLALFRDSLPKTADEEAAVAALFENLAHRVTVLVHQEVDPQDLGLIRRVVDLEIPAHVQAQVLTASTPFIVGAASLVGVDTFLGPEHPPGLVRVDGSQIGVRDLIRRLPSLDPRLEGGWYGEPDALPPPIADPGPPVQVAVGDSFEIDASASRAAEGRRITVYIWTLLE